MKRNFMKAALSGGGTFILKIACNIALLPILMAHLGMAHYGFYLLVIGLSDFLMLMDAGLTTGLIQRLCHYQTTGQTEKAKEQLRIGQWGYGLMVLLLLGIGLAATPSLVQLFSLPSELQQQAYWIFPLVMLEGALNLYGCYFQAILKAHCIYHWSNMVELIQSLLINGGSVVLVLMGYGLGEMMLLRLVATLVKNLIIFSQTIRIEPNTWQWAFGISKSGLQDLFSISLFAMIQEISVVIAHRLDEFVIAVFLTLSEVGCFGLVAKIFGYVAMFCIKVTDAVFPMFTHLEALDDALNPELLRRFFLRISHFINYLMLLPLLLLAALYPEIIRFLSADQINVSQVWPVSIVFILLTWSVGLQIPASKYLFACGKQRFQTYSSLITACCNLGLSLILVKQWGMLGVALGTLIPHVIQHQFVSIWTSCRLLKISLREYLLKVHGKNFAAVAFLGIGLLALRLMLGWQAPALMLYLPGMALIAGVSLFIWLLSALSAEERQQLQDKLAQYLPLLSRGTQQESQA